MARKGEQILVALLAVLQTAEPTTGRNTPLPDLATGGTVIRLLDGDPPEQTEAFLNPPMYEFTARPVVQVIVSGGADDAARDAAVDAKVESLLGAIAGIDTDLNGNVTDIRPQPPTGTPKELFGAPNMKAAEFTIELDFWSQTTAG